MTGHLPYGLMLLRSAARPFLHLGIFVLCLSTLMFEVLLTRIFSVSLWYHFAFLAISVAMFGMAVAALAVHRWPGVFPERLAPLQLAWSALGFAASVVLSVQVHRAVPVIFTPSLVGLGSMLLTYLAFAVPFFCSGLVVCLALSRFPAQAGTLYAADLIGAAWGCAIIVGLLDAIGAPGAVLAVALIALGAGMLFALDAAVSHGARAGVFAAAAVGVLAVGLLPAGAPSATATAGLPVLHTKWNSFSRIQVSGDIDRPAPPFAWALSPAYGRAAEPLGPRLALAIDSMAGTVMTRFAGDLEAVDYLRYDLVSVVHYLRSDARVLVVGAGGGRDVLAALAFRQHHVVGVEINEDILAAVNDVFGDFTGHLDRYPQVTFVNDDARSYLARRTDAYDIIQISMIDTWAATAAGAFALTENSLYTVEAWKLFLDRLAPSGVLTASRWYFGERPGEIYRMTALAAAALRARGVSDPRAHLAIVRNLTEADRAIGIILVSPSPLSAADMDRLEQVVAELEFEIVISPRVARDAMMATLADGGDGGAMASRSPFNTTPPTDDAPFFFQMLRLRDVLDPAAWELGRNTFNMRAVVILAIMLVVVGVLTVLCLVVPLSALWRAAAPRTTLPLVTYFAAIGLGFMLVEGAYLQRLIIFLGHPTYSLSVVLFTLLLSSGIGSALGGRVTGPEPARGGLWLLVLLSTVGLSGLLLPRLVDAFAGAPTGVRIAVAVALLAPAGLAMGMAVPFGLRLATERVRTLTPWLWGVNAATSVFGSVLGVAIALSAGISRAFWTGWVCYLIAFAAIVLDARGRDSSAQAKGRAVSRFLP